MKDNMYRLFVVLIFLGLHLTVFAQTVIPLEKDGGVYKVPCVVNGLKMKFIFDTGAYSVCISKFMASYMLDNGYLTQNDIKGSGFSSIADGSTVKHYNIVLKDIELGGLHLRNVEAVVVDGQEAPLLLGQTAIQKLGPITISGNSLIINDGTKPLAKDQIKSVCEEISVNIRAERIDNALTLLDKLKKSGYSEPRMYVQYAVCFLRLKDYEKAYNYIEEAHLDFKRLSKYGISEYYIPLYQICFEARDYQKSLDIVSAWYNDKILSNEWATKADEITKYAFTLVSDCNFNLEKWDELAKDANLALSCYGGSMSKTYNEMNRSKFSVQSKFIRPYSSGRLSKMYVDDDDTEKLCFYYLYSQQKIGVISNRTFLNSIYNAAQAGSKIARKYLNEEGVDY